MRGKLGSILVVALLLVLGVLGASGSRMDIINDTDTDIDNVIVPLVEEDGNTGIPITKIYSYTSIELIDPRGLEIHVPMKKEPDRIDVTLIDGHMKIALTIVLQDWPQHGDVIPLSQDWPQGAQLHIPINNLPNKTKLCIIVPQDWPQDEIEGSLLE